VYHLLGIQWNADLADFTDERGSNLNKECQAPKMATSNYICTEGSHSLPYGSIIFIQGGFPNPPSRL